MILFDDILVVLEDIFIRYKDVLDLTTNRNFFFVNRDLRGRIVLVWDAACLEQMDTQKRAFLTALCTDIADKLGKHAQSAERVVIEGEFPFIEEQQGAVVFSYGDRFSFTVVDRMLTESSWSRRAVEDHLSSKMAVFYSIKGGVGRSTALAAAAWFLAKKGKKVMVVDMDLESPGLSSSLLSEERIPEYGLLDWLVEDVVENGEEVVESLFATSTLTEDSPGEIVVIPAHGRKYGDYIAKMGRAWMYRMDGETRVSWPQRLHYLLQKLDEQHHPDCILIDARAGLDEIASACVVDLAPKMVLLFAMEGLQTWTGYSILFSHWNRIRQAPNIRESLQMIAAMIPLQEDKQLYIQRLRENAWDCFREYLYDEMSVGQCEGFSFDLDDEAAPHAPWFIHWNHSLSGVKQLYTLNTRLDAAQMEATFPFMVNFYDFFFGNDA